MKQVKHFLKRILIHPQTPRVMTGITILALVVVLARPLVAHATATRITFLGCVSTANRGLQTKPNQTFTFRVKAEANDTFLMEDFGIKQPVKAGQFHTFSVTPKESKWYGFKLEKCGHASGALAALNADGTAPGMGQAIRYMEMNHAKDSSDHNSDHKDMNMEDIKYPPTDEHR